MGECRICQEEDSLKNLESPCACSGSLKLFLLRVVGFLLPCYIMIWAISILQRRRQRQEAAALAAARFAIVVQAAQSRGLLVAPAAPAVVSQPDPRLGRV
ncbi:UNVERIFIED_CONTAM: hypothetical protein Sradi_1804000 [Sesamum radiatum]|uniref:RING-CH-type domain-containing protein n=1 Tax=Sesamum radiatum TaxID=300843 RepID=A0AAW2TUQ9_SESRA